jgi:hypothetical protein
MFIRRVYLASIFCARLPSGPLLCRMASLFSCHTCRGGCGFLGHSGFYGVELFFALSGFLFGNLLIRTGSALAQPDHLVTFYIRRWFRTFLYFGFLSVFKFYSN